MKKVKWSVVTSDEEREGGIPEEGLKLKTESAAGNPRARASRQRERYVQRPWGEPSPVKGE